MLFRFCFLLACVLITTLISSAHVAAQPPENPDDLTMSDATLYALQNAHLPPRDRYQLAAQILGIDLNTLPMPPSVPAPYQLGDWQSFRVFNLNGDDVRETEAQLVALGEHIALWVERGQPVDADGSARLAEAFDVHLYDSVRDLWGSEPSPGVDGDPRIHGLFAGGVGGGVIAYFSSTNLYPAALVPASSAREMLIYSLDILKPPFVLRGLESTTAHEFQHMIRANENNQTDSWVDEGLSVYTQLHLGYEDVLYYADNFMAQPQTQLNTWGSGAGYGASLLFMTYFAERCGLKALQTAAVTASGEALTDFDALLRADCQSDINTFYADWVAANWLRESAGVYGYQHPILTELKQPAAVAEATSYPFTYSGQANQYGADYIPLSALSDQTSLMVTLEIPPTVGLIAPEPLEGASGRFWYSNRADDSATTLTRSFDLTSVSGATLHYRAWYAIEDYWDYAYVLVSADTGETWEPLVSPQMTEDDPNGVAYGAGYTGASDGWLDEALSLDAYAGQSVLLRFLMLTDEGFNLSGLAIDDLRVEADNGETLYRDDFEGELDGWQSEGWVLTDNRLPQYAWVQLMARGDDGSIMVERRLWPSDFTDHRTQFDVDPTWTEAALVVLPITPVTTVVADYALIVEAEQ